MQLDGYGLMAVEKSFQWGFLLHSFSGFFVLVFTPSLLFFSLFLFFTFFFCRLSHDMVDAIKQEFMKTNINKIVSRVPLGGSGSLQIRLVVSFLFSEHQVLNVLEMHELPTESIKDFQFFHKVSGQFFNLVVYDFD